MTGRQADIALAGVRVRKYVGIKDRTFIDTMLRRAAVNDSFLDQNQIPGTGGEKTESREMVMEPSRMRMSSISLCQ